MMEFLLWFVLILTACLAAGALLFVCMIPMIIGDIAATVGRAAEHAPLPDSVERFLREGERKTGPTP